MSTFLKFCSTNGLVTNGLVDFWKFCSTNGLVTKSTQTKKKGIWWNKWWWNAISLICIHYNYVIALVYPTFCHNSLRICYFMVKYRHDFVLVDALREGSPSTIFSHCYSSATHTITGQDQILQNRGINLIIKNTNILYRKLIFNYSFLKFGYKIG